MKKENTTLYAVKALACFSIVSLHFLLPGRFGVFYQIVARFAVPFFMMLSGYFSYGISREKVLRRLRQMLGLAAGSFLFYSLVHLGDVLAKNDLPTRLAAFQLSDFTEFLLFNRASGLIGVTSTPVWYLLAISYIYLLYLIFHRHFRYIANIWVAGALLAAAFCIEFHTDDAFHYRNFLFLGLPFFILGMLLAKHREVILSYRLPRLMGWSTALLLLALTLLEYRILGADYELYPSTLFLTSAVFLYAVRNADRIDIRVLNNLAKKYATMIYIIHPFVIFVFKQVVPRNAVYTFGVFIIFLVSYLFSIGWQRLAQSGFLKLPFLAAGRRLQSSSG